MIENVNFWAIFLTGLFTGGLVCLAVQGGLLTTAMASCPTRFVSQGGAGSNGAGGAKLLPLLAFLFAKLAAYTILGFLLGWIGEVLRLSIQAQVVILIFVGIFMLGNALHLLNVHPVFRYFVIQPPDFMLRFISSRGSKQNLTGRPEVLRSAFLGAFTIFIPCGVTQAMMALAVGSASPWIGALIMFAFVLGTTPIFFLLGYFTLRLGQLLSRNFARIAALIIIGFAIYTLNSAVALTGNFWTLQNIVHDVSCVLSYCGGDYKVLAGAAKMNPVAAQKIIFTDSGYTPNEFAVIAGSEVTLELQNLGAGGCIQAFTVPALNVQQVVQSGDTKSITFKAPKERGRISFMCSAGQYGGVIEVI